MRRPAPAVFQHNENRQSEVVDQEGAPEKLILKAAGYCPTGAIESRTPDRRSPVSALAARAGRVRTIERMTETAYETLPELDSSETRAGVGTVVMKFGGTSVADPEKIRRVAARLVATKRAGARVVAVVSAMGYHPTSCSTSPGRSRPSRKPRELDMLISVGERISCALVAMAISDLGTDAVSLTGSQAGIVTDTAHGKAKIVEVKAHRIHRALDDDRIVLVAGFQGVRRSTT